jgi:hypothetical protein
VSEAPDTTEPPVARYLATVAAYNLAFKKWEERNTKIVRRYRDDARTSSQTETAKFNILWSNVQTLIPAVYAKLPKADVSRRFSDNDPVGRVASLLIERALDYEIEHYPDFRATMNNSVADRFLGGRGVGWVRYDPHIREQAPDAPAEPEDGVQVTEDTDEPGEGQDTENLTTGQEAPAEEIEYECAPTDYVHWKDFGHSIARTWEEVTAVWRWVYMSRDAAKERFDAETVAKMAFNSSPDELTKRALGNRVNDKAKVCELWDKETGKAVWFEEGGTDLLDERDDPLELEGFFPCDKPLYATTTSDSLVPVPDFVLYQDQANELDILTDRIDGLVKALRVRGVYDASQPALQRLLTEGDNNTLIPVDKWAALSEKGGINGSIDLLDLKMIVEALSEAYQAHEQVKQQIYEITGISDIVRGQGAASETATAQRIKGQYAGLRLKSMQETVALFATGLLRLKAQIICTKFQPETILAYAAAAQMTPEDQEMIPQALELIKNNPLRTFRIEVAADSLVQLDEDQDKQDRTEFITALGGFLKEAIPAAQASPELLPMLMESLKFVVAGFKQARQIEGTIDVALQKLVEAAKQPKPDPAQAQIAADAQTEQMKAQMKGQADQMKAQNDLQVAHMKLQMDAQGERLKLQAEQQQFAAEQQMEAQKAQFEMALEAQKAAHTASLERWKAELQADTSIAIAQINAKSAEKVAAVAKVDEDEREPA